MAQDLSVCVKNNNYFYLFKIKTLKSSKMNANNPSLFKTPKQSQEEYFEEITRLF